MKSSKFNCLVLMAKYAFKTIDMMDQLLVIRVNYKKTVNYLEKFSCQAYCFNFQSNKDGLFVKHVVRLLNWHVRFKKRKALKKELNEELMPIPWDSKRQWNFCMPENEKKEIELIFTE